MHKTYNENDLDAKVTIPLYIYVTSSLPYLIQTSGPGRDLIF